MQSARSKWQRFKWYILSAILTFVLYQTIPQTPVIPYTILPQKYLKSVPWNVSIITAPPCPPVAQIYLIKTSPYNFDLRRLSRLMLQRQGGVTAFFVIGLRDQGNGQSSDFCKLLKTNYGNNFTNNVRMKHISTLTSVSNIRPL